MKMKRECRMCGTEFEAQQFRGTFPAYCPTCQDIRQKRPSIIIERELLFGPVIVEIKSLPGKWEEFQARERDLPCCKISVKGRRFGASWRGRIDIFAPKAWSPGDIVEFSEIESVHLVRYKKSYHPTIYGGKVLVKSKLALDSDEGEIELERRRYIRLDPLPEGTEVPDELPRLIWSVASYKTTLKGLGRQYRYKHVGCPIWSASIHGSVRSGRKGAEGVLAIVDDEHPLSVECVFDR